MEILSLGLVDLTQYRRSSIVAARGQSKRPDEINSPGLLFWRRPTLAQPIVALPSGLQRFTSVFGMGTGGATALLSPEFSAAYGAKLWSLQIQIVDFRLVLPTNLQSNIGIL